MNIIVNVYAVLVAALVPMALGFLWYGPLFGKMWMQLVGFTEQSLAKAEERNMLWVVLLQFLGALSMSFVLAHWLVFAGAFLQTGGVIAALANVFWIWLGFIVPVTMGAFLWEAKSWKLWALNASYYLVSLVCMGAILALWV